MKLLTDFSLELAFDRARRGENPFHVEHAVTQAYRAADQAAGGAEPVAREVACLTALFPEVLRPVVAGDLFAGRIRYPLVGFSPEPMGLGYYCRADDVRAVMAASALSAEARSEVEKMLAFWRGRTTAEQTRAAYPATLAATLPTDAWTTASGIGFPLYRMAGTNLHWAKLLKLGLPGMKAELAKRAARAGVPADAQRLYAGMQAGLDVVADACRAYAVQARELCSTAIETHQKDLAQMAAILDALPTRAPKTMREAIQLLWLYALVAGTWNYGRLDDALAPFYARDVAEGRLDAAGGVRLLAGFWRVMNDYSNQYNNRVFIGGMGRVNEAAADEVALLAIEATRQVRLNQPQLSLRFHDRQNPELLARGLDAIGEGCTFPILYNDDVNVPAVMQAFGVARDEAEQYMPFGCGEYVLNHRSVGTPNGVINLTKALEVVLAGGRDPVSGQRMGVIDEPVETYETFEQLWAAYAREVEHYVAALAEQEKIEYDVTGAAAPFVLLSALYDDCLERGKGIFAGGARYRGGTLETYGNTNAADSLTALNELVFKQKKYTLRQIAEACARDFAGDEALQRDLLAAPKYGNDDAAADAMAVRVHEHVCRVTAEQAARVGLDSYLVVVINNWANAIFGRTTAASPDGRKRGEPLANGNNPTQGMDRAGTTAFLNSLVKLRPDMHAGAVQNMKFSRQMFGAHRAKAEALLQTYFSRGGAQAMITVVDRADLEAAMKEPAKWGHLMVRVGGFSARFIDLPAEAQRDVLQRTCN